LFSIISHSFYDRSEVGIDNYIYESADAIDIWGISSAFTSHEFRFAEKLPNQLPLSEFN
jgi:hypothetical protein